MAEPNQNPPLLSPKEFRAKYMGAGRLDSGWEIGQNEKGEDAIIHRYQAKDMSAALRWLGKLVEDVANPLTITQTQALEVSKTLN